MNKQHLLSFSFSLILILSLLQSSQASIRIVIGTCHASGYLTGKSGFCTTQNDANCCQDGQLYPQYRCSPPVTTNTRAVMYISSFTQGSDGGGAMECGSHCLKNITISANGNSVMAMVVDECDSINGCNPDQNYEPPCGPDAITASPAVWDELGVPETQRGELVVTWSEV